MGGIGSCPSGGLRFLYALQTARWWVCSQRRGRGGCQVSTIQGDASKENLMDSVAQGTGRWVREAGSGELVLTARRGTYCLLVVATLLDIITPELVHNVDKFIAGCQTYEGGFACASFPFGEFRAAQAEAHGGYTSCSINSHFLLSSIRPPTPPCPSESGTETKAQESGSGSSLDSSFPIGIDVDAALRWSVMQQGEAIEGGGFRGRSNKLVDGCYSWWVGGGIPVLEALQKKSQDGTGEDEAGESESCLCLSG